jgi:hypothetical protein
MTIFLLSFDNTTEKCITRVSFYSTIVVVRCSESDDKYYSIYKKNDRETSSDLQNSMQKTKELARQPTLKKRG